MAAIQGSLPRPSSLPREEAPIPPLPRNNNTAPQCTGNSSSSKVPDSIDSALLAALRDPRERLGLLKLEQAMIDFYSNSTDPYVDIGGPYNSVVVYPSTGLTNMVTAPQRPQTTFQRCILHRLADRFRMTRETNNPYIRLWKQPDSCLPPRLLVDLDPSEYEEEQVSMTTAPALNNPPKNMKMKIMKRSSSSGVSNSSDTSRAHRKKNSSATNLSEKEKAYAEARARIFSDGDAEDDQSGTTAEIQSVPAAVISTANSTSSLPSSEDDTPNNHASSRPSKATWRNRRQEENDPDFQRGVVLQPTYDYYSQAAPPTWGGQVHQDSNYYGGAYQGRGGRGRGSRYQNNYYGTTGSNYNYRRSNSGEAPANVHSLEEFPTLR